MTKQVSRRKFLTAAAAGTAGAGIAVWWTRALRGVLFGVDPTDPLLVAAVAIIVVGVAQAACLRPARRAMRVDPVRVLNAD